MRHQGTEARQDGTGTTGQAAGDQPKHQPGTAFSAKNSTQGRPLANNADSGDDENMAGLFKTEEAQCSLDQVEEELKKAGLGHGLERVMSQIRETLSGDQMKSVRKRAGNFFKRLKSRVLANPLASQEGPAPGDIVFGLVLTPEAAASGTTIDINYLRDDQPHKLSVKIPPGLTEKTRLRLSGQGHLKPFGNRGDLLLDLSIKKA
jgi:hypothetical protein